MPVRFGVIGLGRGRGLVRIARAVGGIEVTAIYDIDAARAAGVAAEIGARCFDDYAAFLASDIDVVVVASPVPNHAEHAISALAAGKHVLSEVTACANEAEARSLVEAARSTTGVYMMAENYRYLDEVELVRRLHLEGRFGELYFAEGEYLHDCRGLWYTPQGELTWRGRGGLGVYCTHSVGPVLYITGGRVTSVSAMAVAGGRYDQRVAIPTMHLMQMDSTAGVTLRVRVDHVSPRPHQMAYYSVQGTQGSYEAPRGFGDGAKVWMDGVHEPSLFHAPAQWHALGEHAHRVIPERLAAPKEARLGGHGTSEYWLFKEFLAVLRGEVECPIDVYRALDYTLPGIAALESAERGGAPVPVPDPRMW
ncbi:MAG TPA: Gfo/Idh/MocA family oxidoreductase [Candidatus Dormibacteraeota bacterium]|jgi:predicted dehydrogenase|nr:Gfo/Idh/MocA family oxidoreductase [Candidatus Dormibacteraeota bacterium]